MEAAEEEGQACQAHYKFQAEAVEGYLEVADGQSVQAGQSNQGQAVEGHVKA